MKKNLLFALVALLFITGNLFAKKIAFIDQSTNFPINSQSGIVTALTTAGYEVTTIDLKDFATTTPIGGINFSTLATFDLVVISKACNSGMFLDPAVVASWAALPKPYIALTPYIIRSNRLNLVNSTGYTSSADKADFTSITKAVPLTYDQSLEGVTTDLNVFDYFKGYYETVTTTATTMDGNSGNVIVALNTDAVKGAGMPLMIRWAAGATYATGVANAAGRTYLGIGSDNTTLDQNYNNFTEQSLKLFMNEVKRYAPIPAGVNDVKMNNKLVIVKNNCIEMLQSANSVSVVNSVGAIVSTHNIVVAGTTIPLFHNGIYMIKVKSAKGVEVQKIIL